MIDNQQNTSTYLQYLSYRYATHQKARTRLTKQSKPLQRASQSSNCISSHTVLRTPNFANYTLQKRIIFSLFLRNFIIFLRTFASVFFKQDDLSAPLGSP